MGYTKPGDEGKVRVYVASSWRNGVQPHVVGSLRDAGFAVYDFKDPANDKGAFSWSDLGIERPEDWPPERCIEFLSHPRAEEGFRQDFEAMEWADACVLVLPAGRSANLEAGWFVGRGKPLVVLKDHGNPDLMYKMATRVVASVDQIVPALRDTTARCGFAGCGKDRQHEVHCCSPTHYFGENGSGHRTRAGHEPLLICHPFALASEVAV